MTLSKGQKVTVTNYCGSTEETHEDKKYQMIGQTGYVQKFYGGNYFGVVLPESLHYSGGNGAALHISEFEPV